MFHRPAIQNLIMVDHNPMTTTVSVTMTTVNITDNFNDPNESSASSQSPRENTNEQNNATRPSSVTLNNNNNPTASTSSSQSAEENTNGHNNDSPSPQMCPTQRRQVAVVDLSNEADISEEERDDAEVADEGSGSGTK